MAPPTSSNFVPEGNGPEILSTWTKREAAEVHAAAHSNETVLWGCDLEELQSQFLMRELAGLNPGDSNLKQMMELTKNGYKRKIAPALLDLAERHGEIKDEVSNDLSVRKNLSLEHAGN